MGKLYVLILVAIALAHDTSSEIITSERCVDKKTKAAVDQIAEVLQVRVSPCPAPGNGLEVPCKLERGNTATLSVDFVPKVSVQRLRATLGYIRPTLDLNFPALESNGCKSLTQGACPLEAHKNYTWTAQVKLSKAFPANHYPLRLKLTDGHIHRPKVIYCQTFNIDLQ